MSRPSRSHSFPRPTALAAAVLAVALLLSACGGKGDDDGDGAEAAAETSEQGAEGGKDNKGKKETNAIPVEVAQVARRPLSANWSGTASLRAAREAEVVAKTSGVLLELKAEEGDRVRQGQVLARLDADRSRLEVERAEAALNKLQAEYKRSQELFGRKLIAADAHERIRYDLATQRAAWELAKLELSYANVVAPIDGVIAERMVKAGNLIQTNETLFRIVDTSRLEAVLNVPERELATMRDGLPVTMRVDALPGEQFIGRVDRVSPVVDAGSGTFRVTARFDDEATLRAGMFGRVEIVYREREDVLTVPRSALLQDQGEAAVYTVVDNKAVRVPIELGYVNGELAEVVEGLEEGARVVTIGKVAVRDGSELQVINAEPEAAVAQSNGYVDAVAQP